VNLTPEQMQAVERGDVVRVAEAGTPVVVVRADVFDRIARLLYDDSEWTAEEMSRLAWDAGQGIGWDDPAMDAYDDYEKHRP
jgi:hypothetical protein